MGLRPCGLKSYGLPSCTTWRCQDLCFEWRRKAPCCTLSVVASKPRHVSFYHPTQLFLFWMNDMIPNFLRFAEFYHRLLLGKCQYPSNVEIESRKRISCQPSVTLWIISHYLFFNLSISCRWTYQPLGCRIYSMVGTILGRIQRNCGVHYPRQILSWECGGMDSWIGSWRRNPMERQLL